MFERVKKVLVAELGVDEDQVTMESKSLWDLKMNLASPLKMMMLKTY